MTSTGGVRGRRVSRGAGATLLGQAVNALGQAAFVPVALAVWGATLYGEWLTLAAVVAYLNVADIGVQYYVVNRLNQAFSTGHIEDFTRVLHSALALSLVTSGVVVVFAATALYFVPLGAWFDFDRTSPTEASAVAVLLMVQVVGSVPLGIIGGVYRAVGEYARGQMVANVRLVTTFAVGIAVLAAGGTLAAVAASQLVPLIGSALWMIRDLGVRHPEVRIGVGERDRALAVSFIAPSLLFLVIQLAMLATLQGSTLIVSAALGAGAVALFVSLRTLANVIRQLAASIYSAVWPEFTMLEATGRHEVLRAAHALVLKLLLVVSLAGGALLYFRGEQIVDLWTSGNLTFDRSLMNALIVLGVVQMPWTASSVVLSATNRHRRLAVCHVASAVLGLAAGWALVGAWGATGVVLGLIAADLAVCSWAVPVQACRLLGQPLGALGAEIAVRVVLPAGALFLAVAGVNSALPDGVPGLALFTAVNGAAALALALVALSTEERRYLVQAAGAVLKRTG